MALLMIAAVSTMLNEADIAHRTVAHLYNSGIDEIYIALSTKSDDGTRESLAPFPVHIIDDPEDFHYQPRWTNYLAGLAGEAGATWILPFDADEFIYACDGGTIPDALASVTAQVLALASHQHLTMEERFIDELGLGKVAYRWHPLAVLSNGSHSVLYPNPCETAYDILHLRELQFRSFSHMEAKCRERVALLDPTLGPGEGNHQRVLAAMTPDELRAAWEKRCARPTVIDPIPVR